MDEKCIDNFIDFGHKQLSLIEQRNGEVIYSSKETFKKGKNYYENLVEHLNCVVFKYINSNCITFEIKETFNNGGK